MTAYGAPRRSALPARLIAEGFASGEHDARLESLTLRQREVVALVAEGESNAAIAAALGISGKTVERHLSAVFASWGVASRAAVAGIALAAGESFRQPPSARPSAAKTGESARVDVVAPPSPTQ